MTLEHRPWPWNADPDLGRQTCRLAIVLPKRLCVH